MPPEDVIVTELESFEPTRVDGVGKGANGFPILMLKSIGDSIDETVTTIDDVVDAIDKASKRPTCDACDGSGKVDDKKCGKCFGSGVKPMPGDTEKSLMEIAAIKESGVAASGQPVPPPRNCPTCQGSGDLPDSVKGAKNCPDCGGSGRDGQYNTGTTREGFGGAISVGDPQGREKIDKSIDDFEFCGEDDCDVCKAFLDESDPELLEKKRLKAKTRNALPDSSFAVSGRKYPINDESHARNALARVSQYGTPEEKAKVKAAVSRKYPNIDISKGDMSFTGPNPQLAAMAKPVGGDDDDDAIMSGPAPGSPEWEGVDAATAVAAAEALMTAAEHIRTFAQRESVEVAAGEGNDIFDTYVAEDALCAVGHALGIMAQMAFHEGHAAMKGVDGVEKAGRRISMKTAHELVALRDHITNLLGTDDPTASNDDAAKAVEIDMDALSKELEDMTTDELGKLLDARDGKLVSEIVEAMKGKSKMDETAAVSRAKAANSSGKGEGDAATADDDDLEDEAMQGNHDSASGTRNANGGAKAVLTEDEIEAKRVRKAAKKALQEAADKERDAHEHAAIAKAITESKADYENVIKGLEDRLAAMEGRIVPSDVVRTRPAEVLKASSERDALEADVARYERMAKDISDVEMRRAYADKAKDAKSRLAAIPTV